MVGWRWADGQSESYHLNVWLPIFSGVEGRLREGKSRGGKEKREALRGGALVYLSVSLSVQVDGWGWRRIRGVGWGFQWLVSVRKYVYLTMYNYPVWISFYAVLWLLITPHSPLFCPHYKGPVSPIVFFLVGERSGPSINPDSRLVVLFLHSSDSYFLSWFTLSYSSQVTLSPADHRRDTLESHSLAFPSPSTDHYGNLKCPSKAQ